MTEHQARNAMRTAHPDEYDKAIRADLAAKAERELAGPAIRLRDLKMIPPVDRSARTLLDGSPVTEDHREIDPASGMQKGYVVLSAEERAKGFVRPVRLAYTHVTCNGTTTMALALAETYARDPGFYSGTFCCSCQVHRPVDQFVWKGTQERLGS